jgi:hypothetical protein
MTYHVDVIESDWAAGVERLAARLVLNGKDVLLVDSPDPETWTGKLLRPVPDGFGEMLAPDSDPKLFLTLLVDRLEQGSYVRAFAPHEEDECPLHQETEWSMRQVAVGGNDPVKPPHLPSVHPFNG